MPGIPHVCVIKLQKQNLELKNGHKNVTWKRHGAGFQSYSHKWLLFVPCYLLYGISAQNKLFKGKILHPFSFSIEKGQKVPRAVMWYQSTSLYCPFVVYTLKDLGTISQLQPPLEINIIEAFYILMTLSTSMTSAKASSVPPHFTKILISLNRGATGKWQLWRSLREW